MMNLQEYTCKIESDYYNKTVIEKKNVYLVYVFHVCEEFTFVGYDILDKEESNSSLVFYQGIRKLVPFEKVLDVFTQKCQGLHKIDTVYSSMTYLAMVIIADSHFSTEFMSHNFQ